MKESRGASQKHQCLTRVLRGASELARQMRGEKIPLGCLVMNAFPCKGTGPLIYGGKEKGLQVKQEE